MAYSVTLIPGDGIGPEVIEAARRVLEATGVVFSWDVQQAGAAVMEQRGTPLPQAVLDSIRANGVALKGPIATPVGTGFHSVNVRLRRELDLYVNVRPIRSMEGIAAPFREVDLVVVRENTEGLYLGIEHEVIPDQAAEAVRLITRRASERVVRFAFEYARANGRRQVTAVHKANILKLTDGLFLRAAREVAAGYPEIVFNERIIDNMVMQLVSRPAGYDVLVAPNLYGDIVSDLCSGLVGGLGMVPGASYGPDRAMFEPGHGSAPDIAGRDLANPAAAILSGAMMLRYLGEGEAAERVQRAVEAVVAQGRSVTVDLKPEPGDPTAVGTGEMAAAIAAAL